MTGEPRERRYLWRAICAPFVVFSFLDVLFFWLDRWPFVPDTPLWDVLAFGLSVLAGVAYLWRLPWTRRERALATIVWIPLMLMALFVYCFFFALLVLNVYL